MAAVQESGQALYYASEELKNDREVVLAAVQQNGEALRNASPERQNDPVINWFAQYSDRLTQILGEDKLNYANVKELYQNHDLDILRILHKQLKRDTKTGQYAEAVVMLARERLRQSQSPVDTSDDAPGASAKTPGQ